MKLVRKDLTRTAVVTILAVIFMIAIKIALDRNPALYKIIFERR